MDDRTITVSISDEEDEFIAGQISAGNFSDENSVIKAALEALERETKLRELRSLIAEGDADFEEGRSHTFGNAEDLKQLLMSRVRHTGG